MVRTESQAVEQCIQAQGGAWIAGHTRGLTSILRLACAAEHVWETTVEQLLNGRWCPRCARYKYTIADMRKLARRWSGQCLSKSYQGTLVHLRWRCTNGHEWMATPNTILGGCWCPTCRLAKGSIEELQAIAEQRGGECLSRTYRNKTTRLSWRCQEGHEWEANPGHVKRGSWCPQCAGHVATIQDMQALAVHYGGECLSKRYVNSSTPLRWRCAKGHGFRKRPAYIKEGSWCPTCSPRQPGSLKRMQAAARKRGGRCVSIHFVNMTTKLDWECKNGHVWSAVPSHVLAGSWCPKCANSAQRTIQQMRELASSRGGRCLSPKYLKSRVRLHWSCAEGHRFDATPMAVVAGRWCLKCKRASHSSEHSTPEKRLG